MRPGPGWRGRDSEFDDNAGALTSLEIMTAAPDIALLAAEWQPRALIRAQLIEEGFEVVATDTWPMMRRHLRPGSKPRLAVVDLKGLPCPRDVLADLRALMKPTRVLVLTASGTMAVQDIERLGFHPLPRPVVIDEIVRVAGNLIRSADEHAAIS
jgi:ActR/RegA family two-component response regulator